MKSVHSSTPNTFCNRLTDGLISPRASSSLFPNEVDLLALLGFGSFAPVSSTSVALYRLFIMINPDLGCLIYLFSSPPYTTA